MPFTMTPAGYAALVFTVAMLVTTAYFLMGGLPLLILQHDSPLDEKFVRRFFDIYYKAALVTAGGAAISYALWGRWPFALGAAAIVALALLLRRQILPQMEELGPRMQSKDPAALRSFRRVHLTALLANLVQLLALGWAVTKISV